MWGRITEVHKADGSTEKYTYDHAGNITSSTDGNGNTTEYAYNSLNLMSCITDAVGDTINYKYDVAGRVARKTDRNRRVTEYVYNMDNNLTMRKDLATSLQETYAYNVDGTLKQASGGNITYSYEYTPSMRLKAKKSNGKPILRYTYDADSNVTELKDVTGRLTQYKYDLRGRMQEVWDGNRKEAEYSYNDDGTLAKVTFANGVTAKYTYDDDKNIAQILTQNSQGVVILDHRYVYDNNGNQIEKNENGEETKYIYDKLNRLSKAVYAGVDESFEYDMAGNRIKRTLGNTQTTYSYDRRNRLSERSEINLATQKRDQLSYKYDPQGNLLEESGRRGTTKHTYDCFNRTAGVQSENGSFIKNRYDAEGLRCEIRENGNISRFIYSGRDIIAELDANDTLKTATIRGQELIAQKGARGESNYYLNNAHGDVTALVDGTGEVVNSYKYDAFGNTVDAVEKVQNRFKYAGEQYDAVTGQYYLRARFYNPVVGRLTQEDTYRGDGLNLYSYVQNNPVKYVDPSGYSSECESKNSVFPNNAIKGKKGSGGLLLPTNPIERQTVLNELQSLTSNDLAVDKDGYVYIDNIASISTTPKGDELIERIVNSNKKCTIEISSGNGNAHGSLDQVNAINGVGSDSIVYFDPSSNPYILTLNSITGQVEPQTRPNYIGLGHELIHADRSMRGVKIAKGVKGEQTYTDMFGSTWTESVRTEELATVGISDNGLDDITENCLRKEHGLRIRGAY